MYVTESLTDGDVENDKDTLFAEPRHRTMVCVKRRKCRLFFCYGTDLPLVDPSTQLPIHNSCKAPRFSNVRKLPQRTGLVQPCVCLQACK
jgi:hypothetical protein